jgi:hypothetical protein
MTRIDVVIDELVLVGFDPRDRHRLADAVQLELERGLAGADLDTLRAADGWSAPAPIDVHATAGPGPAAPAGARAPEAVGRQVGMAVAGTLGRGPAPADRGRRT